MNLIFILQSNGTFIFLSNSSAVLFSISGVNITIFLRETGKLSKIFGIFNTLLLLYKS